MEKVSGSLKKLSVRGAVSGLAPKDGTWMSSGGTPAMHAETHPTY